jgi:hypothetical protein
VADVQVMRRVLEGDIPSARSVNPECDERLDRIIEKCLARKPEDRYATALELQAEIDRLSEQLGKPVQPKVIGRYVADLFAESRSEMRRIIETQLSNLDSDQLDLPEVGPRDEMSGSEPLRSRATKISRRQRSWLLLLLPATLILALGLWFAMDRDVEPESESPAVVTQPQPLQAPSADPTPVQKKDARIEFRVSPRDANLFLDDKALEPGVTSVVLPIGDELHTLRAQADGHETASLGFTVKKDARLDLNLVAAAPAKGKKWIAPKSIAPPVPPPAAGQSAPPPAKPASPDCSDPFFIDKGGIKRVRPECR